MQKVARQIPDEHPDKYLKMPDGLNGYWWETDNLICVAFVEAYKSGAFSKFLKDIEARGKAVFFPIVVSARLEAILRTRGYVDAFTPDKYFGVVGGLARFDKGSGAK